MQALSALQVLADKLVQSLSFHLDGNYKTSRPRESNPLAGQDNESPHRLRYPQCPSASGQPSDESQGYLPLSFCGGVFLIIESISPLLATAHARIVAASLRVIHTVLPYLLEPTFKDFTDLDLARLHRLLQTLSKVLGAGTTPANLTEPVAQLALHLLKMAPPNVWEPSQVPGRIITVASQTLLQQSGIDSGEHPADESLTSYVHALEPSTIQVLQTSRAILKDAIGGVGILQPLNSQGETILDIRKWLRTQLLRVQDCLGLLCVVPERRLVGVAAHLWMAAMVGPEMIYVSRGSIQGLGEAEPLEMDDQVGGHLLLNILSLNELGNRKAAYIALAQSMTGESMDDDSSVAVKTLLASVNLQVAPSTPTILAKLIRHGFLSTNTSTSHEALYHLLTLGIRQQDVQASGAAWTILNTIIMHSVEELSKGNNGVVASWVPFLPHLQAAREQAALGEDLSMELEILGGGVSETLIDQLLQVGHFFAVM